MVLKFSWKLLLLAPGMMGAVLLTAASAIAADVQDSQTNNQTDSALIEGVAIAPNSAEAIAPIAITAPAEIEIPVELAQVPVEQTAPASDITVDSLEQIMEYTSEGNSDSLDQVTSISQLSDVQPTDWAFQALQSLVERYGVIAGYPDGTYRGNRALTRYEFAAGLNAALDRVNELIAAGLADAVTREDLATLQRLQEEFAAELATLRGRVDALEARTAELEANQFSTTTKLRGETIFNITGVLDEDEVDFDGDGEIADSQITFGYRVRLNFDTSFTGEDTLRTRFQVRDVENFESDPIGFSFAGDSEGDFQLDNLYYTFPLGDRVQILIGANGLDVDELVASTISPLDSSTDGSVSNFGFPTQYILSTGDAGAGAIIQLTDNLSLDFGYTGGEASDPSPGAGLFNGDYSIIGQLTFLSDPVDAALTYVNTYVAGGISVYDFDGPTVANTYGAQVNFRLIPGIEIGGGIAYANSVFIDTGSAEAWSYQGTLAFRDLGSEGSLLGILAGVPLYSKDILPRDDTGFLVEGFYNYQLTDNISITPSVIWITDPFNNDDNDDTIIGSLRTSFTF